MMELLAETNDDIAIEQVLRSAYVVCFTIVAILSYPKTTHSFWTAITQQPA
ncbi:hypothetical protein [Bythopirellula polymerisocia]|uniref:hypothetical protein n=1 Tax=Bythopirellula polymerisocia TaxID=2528003 RepID=UPI0018D4BF11|nr:hypothetical protein [Bythopirellula polymerisocia]